MLPSSRSKRMANLWPAIQWSPLPLGRKVRLPHLQMLMERPPWYRPRKPGSYSGSSRGTQRHWHLVHTYVKSNVWVCGCAYIYIYMYYYIIYICISICMCLHLCKYVYQCVNVIVCMYIYIYTCYSNIYIYIYNIHIYIYILCVFI